MLGHNKLRRRTFAATIPVLVGLIISSCGSSSPKTSANASGTPTSQKLATGQKLSGSPLVFGVISSDSGAAGTDNDMPTTAKNWSAYVNSHGGIAGHPVDVVVEDDADSAATALQDAQDLIQNKHAIAIGDASFTSASFEKAADAAKVPVIAMNRSAGNFIYTTDPNWFPDGLTITGSVWGLPKMAALSGSHKFAFLYCAEVSACAQAVPLIKTDAASVGVTVVYTTSYSASEPNYTAICLAAEAKGVDSLVAAGPNQLANERVSDDCAKQNYYPVPVAGIGSLGTGVAKDPKMPIVWGFTATLPWFVNTSIMSTFHTVMNSYLPSANSPADVAADWTGLQLFATAAQKVGQDPTAQGIYAGLYGLNGSTLGGLTSPLSFHSGAPTLDNCLFVYKIAHGTYTSPEGTTPVCANLPK